MSYNQNNKVNMPEDQDNEQGGAPLSEPLPRPKSVLNPTTEAYRPKTTLKDLEATYQKVTQGPRKFDNGPIDLGTPTPAPRQPALAGHQTLGNFIDDDPFVTKPKVLRSVPMPLLAPGVPHGFPPHHMQPGYAPHLGPGYQVAPVHGNIPAGHGPSATGLPMRPQVAYSGGTIQGQYVPDQLTYFNGPHVEFVDGKPARYYYLPGQIYGGPVPGYPQIEPTHLTVSTVPGFPSMEHMTGYPAAKPAGGLQASNCFGVDHQDPGTDLVRVDNRPELPQQDQPGAPGVSNTAQSAAETSQKSGQYVSEAPKDAEGYTDPYITTPQRTGKQGNSSSSEPVSTGNKAALVLHQPKKDDPSKVDKLRPKPEMLFKPDRNPQRLFFKDEWYTLNVGPLPAAPIPANVWNMRSEELRQLTSGPTGYPTIAEALDPKYFPFEATSEEVKRSTRGVMRIKNIPFNTRRCEIIALFGKNGRILNDVDEPVHIIMDRVSSKTNDAYVEFVDRVDAVNAMARFRKLRSGEKPPRLGDRTIIMEVCDQADLMKDLFPRANNVVWDDNIPLILPDRTDRVYGNFRGFISEEEMVMLVKHVDAPYRAPFSKECPQRPYECLISTLKKMPWCCPEGITVRQRDAIFQCAFQLIMRLKNAIINQSDSMNLSPQLLGRLGTALMLCPGFTMTQKDDFVYLLNMNGKQALAYCLPRFAASWCHLYGLRPKHNVPLDLLEWYIAVIREETLRLREAVPLATRIAIQNLTDAKTESYFGDFWVELHRAAGPAFDTETLANCIERELICVERVLRRAFGH